MHGGWGHGINVDHYTYLQCPFPSRGQARSSKIPQTQPLHKALNFFLLTLSPMSVFSSQTRRHDKVQLLKAFCEAESLDVNIHSVRTVRHADASLFAHFQHFHTALGIQI